MVSQINTLEALNKASMEIAPRLSLYVAPQLNHINYKFTKLIGQSPHLSTD